MAAAQRARRRRALWLATLVLGLTLALIGVALSAFRSPPNERQAGELVGPASAERFVTPGGDDRGPCSRAQPCASFGRAYALARPGEGIEVAGGRYPAQTIPALPGARSPGVTLRPARGARVQVAGELQVFGAHVEVSDMQVGNWYVKPGAHDVVLRDLDAGGPFFITSATNISVIGGRVGPGINKNPELKAATGSSVPPTNILIEGVEFHDFYRTDPSAHVECLHVMAADNLVLRGNRFHNCEAFDVLFTEFGAAGSPRNVVVENNFFSCCRSGYYAVYLGGGHGERYANFLIRNNTSDKSFSVGADTTSAGSKVRFYGNVAPSVNPLLCKFAGVTWDYNVWGSGEGCGPHDVVSAASSASRDRGHPRSFPLTDRDGDRRPAGAAPDAGADEVLAG